MTRGGDGRALAIQDEHRSTLVNFSGCIIFTSDTFIYCKAKDICFLGNIPNSVIYRNVGQYPNANHVPGILILKIDAPIYFTNAIYLKERWIDEEEDRIKATGKRVCNIL
ncbi:unnamed protein product [Lupinus luteus]|uniref:STAS domain-containing protein n=1 Tax=Lupinus luteus TaxID=3873 RepID=A0AAV1WB16_LUPLU